MDKAAVFIDGGYFAKILQGFGEPRLNFEDFSNELCKRSNAERFRTYFYDCMPYQGDPPTPEEKRRYKDKQSFITYLSKLPRFEVRLGKLSRFDSICNHCGSKTREYKQKRVDHLLTVDLVRLSWRGMIQKAILITGDSDYVPAVKEAKDAGVLVQVYYYRGPNTTIHDELYALCDDRFKIDQDLINHITV